MKTTKGCDNCEYSGRPSYAYPCYVCIEKNKWEAKAKPQTNADYIQGMTDKELAEAMSIWCIGTEDCKKCPWYDNCPESESVTDWLEWLQQPYREDDRGAAN